MPKRPNLRGHFARLCQIGIALSNERDLTKLLELILREARAMTHAEGGTLYLREGDHLEFSFVQNESLEKRKDGFKASLKGRRIPIDDHSLCGRSVLSKQILNIPDLQQLGDDGYEWTAREFDEINHYHTRSMLVVPLKDQSGDIIGVLQLINARAATGEIYPFDPQFEVVIGALASQAAVAVKNAKLTAELHKAYRESLFRLSIAAEYRDDVTASHIKRMSQYCAIIAQAYGLSTEEVDHLRIASPMHDIGKIGIPDAILLKPGALTPEEFDVIKKHPEIGAAILGNSTTPILHLARVIALTHHEKFDGTGYPHGLKGDAIPLAGRIVAVADVFDALTTERLYKPAMPTEFGTDYIVQHAGTFFDPDCVKAFQAVHDKIVKTQRQQEEAYEPPRSLKMNLQDALKEKP